MTVILQRYATPFITGLFLVSLISGIALFFHVGQGWFHRMHEWLSMVLILPFFLHLWRNRHSFVNYFRRTPMALALVSSMAASLYFVIPDAPSEGRRAGGPPQFAFTSRILDNPPSKLAPLLGASPEELVRWLTDSGFSAAASDLPLTEIAARSGKSEGELVQNLVQQPRAR